jgi:hypothetical protein
MKKTTTTVTQGQSLIPSREFWRALFVVFEYYLAAEVADFQLLGRDIRPPKDVWKSLQFLDSCLDLAVTEGWVEDPH